MRTSRLLPSTDQGLTTTFVCLLLLLGGVSLPKEGVPLAAAAALAEAEAGPTTKAKQRRRRRRRPRGQQRPTVERIQEIQQALIREGYLEGKPTGRWDSKTRAAMIRLQEENGFPANGKIDARSLVKLGLGSETAGVAAPRRRAGEPERADEPDDKPEP